MLSIKKYFLDKKNLAHNIEKIKRDNTQVMESYQEGYREYAEYLKNSPMEKKIFYESENGKKMEGGSLELFLAFKNRTDFSSYEHIWIIRKKKEYKEYKKEFQDSKNVKFLFVGDEVPNEYYRHLATSLFLVQGGLFPTCFVKRQGQSFIQIPRIESEGLQGYNMEEGSYKMSNRMHNYLQTDYMIIKNGLELEVIKKDYKLEGIYNGSILEADTAVNGKDIWETVLKEKESVKIISGLPTGKKKLLFYGGGLAMNGVTEALMALLREIDYDSFDVTILFWLQDGTYSRGNLKRVDSRARVLLFKGADPMTLEEQLQILYLKDYGISDNNAEKIYEKSRYLLKRAIMRRIGDTSYDDIIDFSGYAVWIPLLLLEVKAKKRLIWEHPDIKEDFAVKNSRDVSNKTVQLEGLLSIYNRFDKIVAVNEILMKLNREKLGTPETNSKFCYATNLMDILRLEQKIAQINEESYLTDENGTKYLVYDSLNTSINGTIRMLPLIKAEGAIRFVTMGRLSQEKNHVSLILAFKRFLKEYPQSQLFIIGKGVLNEELEELIVKNKLEKDVILTGNLLNPYLLIKNCDCFIFPSRYEGQGLVVLEARMLNMPIVMSDYDVAEAVCVEHGQLMMGKEPNDIYQGMIGFAEGKVPIDYEFDAAAYNSRSLKEFYRTLED